MKGLPDWKIGSKTASTLYDFRPDVISFFTSIRGGYTTLRASVVNDELSGSMKKYEDVSGSFPVHLCVSLCVPPWLTRWSWTQECKKLVGPFHILLFIHQSHFDITQHCLPQRKIPRLYNGLDLLSIKATFPPTILMSSMHRIESIFPPFGCMVSTYHRPTHSSPRFLLFTDS